MDLASLVITILTVLVSSRSWRPLRQFFQNIWADWTLYTFLFYSTLPWLSWALFDEILEPNPGGHFTPVG